MVAVQVIVNSSWLMLRLASTELDDVEVRLALKGNTSGPSRRTADSSRASFGMMARPAWKC
jgi:hypothetical protein